MRYLLISLCLLMVGCSSYPKKNNFEAIETNHLTSLNPYFSNPDLDYIYKAQISIKENNFGGILIIKKINMQEHRVVFTTEIGNKIFDFSYIGNEFKVNSILADMDKKILINLLKKDFKVLIEENPQIENSYTANGYSIIQADIYKNNHYYFFKENSLEKVVKTKNGKENTSFIFSAIDTNIAKNIQILHNKIKLEITLRKI
ncbi:MAG: hypothetical protein PSN34_12425 [Urechidicola sp.]|nr:hypothetical protein [Urechidicola sp.]